MGGGEELRLDTAAARGYRPIEPPIPADTSHIEVGDSLRVSHDNLRRIGDPPPSGSTSGVKGTKNGTTITLRDAQGNRVGRVHESHGKFSNDAHLKIDTDDGVIDYKFLSGDRPWYTAWTTRCNLNYSNFGVSKNGEIIITENDESVSGLEDQRTGDEIPVTTASNGKMYVTYNGKKMTLNDFVYYRSQGN